MDGVVICHISKARQFISCILNDDEIMSLFTRFLIGVLFPFNVHKGMTRNSPLRSKSPLKRRLRTASPKRQSEYNQYAKEKKAYMALHPQCERCKTKKATDLHHKAGRVGKWLCRYEYFAALCRECHDFIHANGKEARRSGWIIDGHKIDLAGSCPSENPISCPSEQ